MKRSALPSKSMDNPAAVFIRFAIGFSRRSVKAGHPFAAIATHYSPRRTQSSDWDVILFLVGHENLQEVTPWIRKGPGAVNSWCQRDSQRERSFKSTKSPPPPPFALQTPLAATSVNSAPLCRFPTLCCDGGDGDGVFTVAVGEVCHLGVPNDPAPLPPLLRSCKANHLGPTPRFWVQI